MAQEEGNTTGYQRGNLRRRLPQITLISFDEIVTPDALVPVTFRIKVQGLSRLLAVEIGIGIASKEGTDRITYGVSPGTVQITPVFRREGHPPLPLKPAMLVPQNIPCLFIIANGTLAGGDANVPLGGDEAWVDIVVDRNEYFTSNIIGRLMAEITGTYIGGIAEPKVIERTLGELRALGPDTVTFTTGE